MTIQAMLYALGIIAVLIQICNLIRQLLRSARRTQSAIERTLYPVYSIADIERAEHSMRQAWDKYQDAARQVGQIQFDEKKVYPEGIYSEAEWRAYWASSYEHDHQRAIVHFLIEGNLKVLNGQTGIDEVMKGFGEKFGLREMFQRMKMVDDRWLQFVAESKQPKQDPPTS